MADERIQPSVQAVHDDEWAVSLTFGVQALFSQLLKAETQVLVLLRPYEHLKERSIGLQIPLEGAIGGQQNHRDFGGYRLGEQAQKKRYAFRTLRQKPQRLSAVPPVPATNTVAGNLQFSQQIPVPSLRLLGRK